MGEQKRKETATNIKREWVQVSFRTVRDLLKGMGYSPQSNKKDLALKEGHPDRNAQFEYINERAKSFISEHEPV
ncbi:MAG: ISAzo13 family transposase, partial [Synergistaceae bacterium]|nr:ISAzo13 family transposase [Synergistaceae bacterium]